MLKLIEQQFDPFIAPTEYDLTDRIAAVLVALVDHPNATAVVLTQRAEHLSSHPGQVSFPGGKYEPGDKDLLATALRETQEEIGLPSDAVRILAELPVRQTRFDIGVVPYLGVIQPGHSYRVDRSELDAVFEVPLRFFMDKGNIRYQMFDGPGYQYRMPCYNFSGYIIWGFTLKVLIELLNHTLHAGIVLQYPEIPVSS